MSAGQVQTTGIVIRVKPYGERDKLVTLLTATAASSPFRPRAH